MAESPETKNSPDRDLEFLLMGLTDEQKKVATDHFYRMALGDPHGFNAGFAVMVQILAHSLRTYPYRLKKFLDAKTRNLADELTEPVAVLKRATEATSQTQIQIANLGHKLATIQSNQEAALGKLLAAIEDQTLRIEQAAGLIKDKHNTLADKTDELKHFALAHLITVFFTGIFLGSTFVWYFYVHH